MQNGMRFWNRDTVPGIMMPAKEEDAMEKRLKRPEGPHSGSYEGYTGVCGDF